MKNKKLILILSIIIIISIIIIKIKPSTNKEIYIEKDKIKETSNNIGVYIEQENGAYTYSETIPNKEDGYLIDNNQSACDGNVNISWDNDTWSAVLSNINKDNVNCYLFFKKGTAKDTILEGKNIVASPDSFSGPDSTDHTGTLYKTEDNDGDTYYYRGSVIDNWIKFGENDNGDKDIWWRIIRINGDESIRLIYSGMFDKDKKPTNPNFETDVGTLVATSPFTSSSLYNDNTYVGFYHGTEGGTYPENHSNATAGNAATQLKNWYSGSDWSDTYNQYIDPNAGFCNDRTKPASNTNGSYYTQEGYDKKPTVYGPAYRVMQTGSISFASSQKPTLKCGQLDSGQQVNDEAYRRDLYTLQGASKGNKVLEVPVGLITIDEVIFAGGFAEEKNSSYYLYNNQNFWTMSPYFFSSSYAYVFYVHSNGGPNHNGVHWTDGGIRPVINLKANIKLSGEGTTNNPYVITE